MEQFNVEGMSCAACVAHVEKAVRSVEGVEDVSVSLLTNSMTVEGSADISAIINTFEGLSDRIVVTEDNKLRLSTRYGETLYLNLENHVENLIMDYVYGM